MTVKEAYNTFGVLPNKFTLEDGKQYWIETVRTADPDNPFCTHLWEQDGEDKILSAFAYGKTKEDSERNLVNHDIFVTP